MAMKKKKEAFRCYRRGPSGNGATHSRAMTRKSFHCKTLNPRKQIVLWLWKETMNLTPSSNCGSEASNFYFIFYYNLGDFFFFCLRLGELLHYNITLLRFVLWLSITVLFSTEFYFHYTKSLYIVDKKNHCIFYNLCINH